MENVVETVRFKLNQGTDVQSFLADAEGTTSFVKGRAGFQYRSLSLNEETQEWLDIIYWDTMENAKAASDNFMSNESAQKMVSHIDEASLVMATDFVKMSICSSSL
ncbi:hypothetical protein [Enterovibrio sp. 27052020O]|uniref:hypothetical protein n=1 Tax=Enterovibrio sp. 27052020O TaxID=3241166 RepID=UPI00388F6807